MENKYYTPNISEFYVGFEYEWKSDSTQTPWTKSIMTEENGPIKDMDAQRINDYRVKYLDKSDIESLGFKYIHTINAGESIYRKPNSSAVVVHSGHGGITDYYVSNGPLNFRGNIKNKSELKKLLKQLGINEN